MKNTPTLVREAWLNRAIHSLDVICLGPAGLKLPRLVRAACGFPYGRSHAVGQCWHPSVSDDGATEVFISPELSDRIDVLHILLHELVHACLENKSGHGKLFKTAATKVGLEGKMTATVPGIALKATLRHLAERLGVYPHNAPKKQGTRLLKVECPGCGYTARITGKWIDIGLPTCPCGEEMKCEEQNEDP